jgi:hypothetical protein
MKKLFDSAGADDYSKLCWRIFASYFGSEDCAKLSLQDRMLVVDMCNAFEKYFHKKCKEEDELIGEMNRTINNAQIVII